MLLKFFVKTARILQVLVMYLCTFLSVFPGLVVLSCVFRAVVLPFSLVFCRY